MSEILGIDTNNYAVQSIRATGGGEINLQDKSVTITQNGTTTVNPDTGYDGLSSVEVNTNVQSNYNTKMDASYGFNYNYGLNTIITEIKELDTSSVTNMYYAFRALRVVTFPMINTSSVTNMEGTFTRCNNLTTIPLIDTANVTNMSSMFNQCPELVTIPSINTSKVQNTNSMFGHCAKLQNLPVFNLEKVTNCGYMFDDCPLLTNESLNNVLASLISVTRSLNHAKTLKAVGLSSSQATICQSLSNWDAFVAAGWSSGY